MSAPVSDTVERFLEHKRAIGRKYLSEEAELRLLVRFAQQRGDQPGRPAHRGGA